VQTYLYLIWNLSYLYLFFGGEYLIWAVAKQVLSYQITKNRKTRYTYYNILLCVAKSKQAMLRKAHRQCCEGGNFKKIRISITNLTYKKLTNLHEFRIGNQIKLKLNQFLDTLISNFIDYERKTPFLIIPLIGDRPDNLANLARNLGTLCYPYYFYLLPPVFLF
jgi:hypothetical protein